MWSELAVYNVNALAYRRKRRPLWVVGAGRYLKLEAAVLQVLGLQATLATLAFLKVSTYLVTVSGPVTSLMTRMTSRPILLSGDEARDWSVP